MAVIVSRHAKMRIRQRLHLPARACGRMADRAFAEGLSPSSFNPAAKRRLEEIAQHRTQVGAVDLLRVYRGSLFLFAARPGEAGVTLVTVWPVPAFDHAMAA